MTRAGLFRASAREKLEHEMSEDEQVIFASFRACGDKQQSLELFKRFRRHLLNSSALASYHGMVHGYRCFELGRQFPKEQFSQKHSGRCIIECIRRERRKNGNQELKVSDQKLCAYLSREGVPIPITWEAPISRFISKFPKRFFRKFKVHRPGESPWEEALLACPKLVAPYLSRYRKYANDTQVLNALFVWPRLIRKHNQEAAKKHQAEPRQPEST